jgi:hypothetical protein
MIKIRTPASYLSDLKRSGGDHIPTVHAQHKAIS